MALAMEIVLRIATENVKNSRPMMKGLQYWAAGEWYDCMDCGQGIVTGKEYRRTPVPGILVNGIKLPAPLSNQPLCIGATLFTPDPTSFTTVAEITWEDTPWQNTLLKGGLLYRDLNDAYTHAVAMRSHTTIADINASP